MSQGQKHFTVNRRGTDSVKGTAQIARTRGTPHQRWDGRLEVSPEILIFVPRRDERGGRTFLAIRKLSAVHGHGSIPSGTHRYGKPFTGASPRGSTHGINSKIQYKHFLAPSPLRRKLTSTPPLYLLQHDPNPRIQIRPSIPPPLARARARARTRLSGFLSSLGIRCVCFPNGFRFRDLFTGS